MVSAPSSVLNWLQDWGSTGVVKGPSWSSHPEVRTENKELRVRLVQALLLAGESPCIVPREQPKAPLPSPEVTGKRVESAGSELVSGEQQRPQKHENRRMSQRMGSVLRGKVHS